MRTRMAKVTKVWTRLEQKCFPQLSEFCKSLLCGLLYVIIVLKLAFTVLHSSIVYIFSETLLAL